MDIQDLRIFTRVAALQNLSAVGTELGLTPGTISKRIQALEQELRVTLFERTTRSIRITAEGKLFQNHAQRMLQELESARVGLSNNVTKPAGRLRIAAPTGLARRFIAPAVANFLAEHEEVELRVELVDRPVSLLEEEYDAAIHVGTLADSTMIVKRLASDRQRLVASPKYLKAHGHPQTPSDLTKHNCLLLGQGRTWTLRNGDEEHSIRISGRLRSDDSDFLRYAAHAGSGILRLSSCCVDDDIERNRLQIVLPEYEIVSDSSISLIYMRSKHVLPRLRALIDHLTAWSREHLDQEPQPLARTPGQRTKVLLDPVIAETSKSGKKRVTG